MIDLDDLDFRAAANKGAAMELAHPTSGLPIRQDDGSMVTVTLAGQDSDQFVKFERASADKRYKQAERLKRLTLTADAVMAENIERLVACTLGWSGVAWGGASKEFSPENARELYRRWPWALEQAERFVSDRANFSPVA